MLGEPRSCASAICAPGAILLTLLTLLALGPLPTAAQEDGIHTGGIPDPVSSALAGQTILIPNTDQSVDGFEQTSIEGDVVYEDAFLGNSTSLLGHTIDHVASPNDDMRLALLGMATASEAGDGDGMRAAAQELLDILLGTTQGRIYDGFSMLNFNRFKDARVPAEAFPPDAMPGEYKMKLAELSGDTFISPFDGEVRQIWDVNVSMLYYDGQIDSDTFLVRFPYGHHPDDTLRVHYRIYSLVQEDFSPTLVMLDRRMAQDTVSFPYKGFDAVWVAFFPGQVVNLTINYPPVRMVRGVYTWGWRVHPPRIQFLQPIYEIKNAHTGEIELDPQGFSFAYRNREELTLDTIGEAAPELKMHEVAWAALQGASTLDVQKWMTKPDEGPAGTWIEWADLAKEQRQLPAEAWAELTDEGLRPGDFGDYNMITAFLNNEMYGVGPFLNEIKTWDQGETFKVKLINLDRHTHYFRNVDFGARLHDDILRCCGGGETSFEIMNFKPSYGAPKVAEMQWRAGWGFRPHYNVVQQQGVFSRTLDRVKIKPYTGGFGDTYFGYQYSEAARGGDFRFNPPPFIITDHDHPSPFTLADADGEPGLVIGQHTEGYGTAQVCAGDPWPGFCSQDLAPFNPNGVRNWPAPNDPTVPKTELRFPPFLRNPAQGVATAGDIIPPTGAWRPFLWISPHNGTLYIDPNDESKGFWADLTYSHGAPVFAKSSLAATVELPRASGQVFYQFDDLFHDNSIFSPHPVQSGLDENPIDEVSVNAFVLNGITRIRGRVSELPNGAHSEWVSLFNGPAGPSGCTGTLLEATPVNLDQDGFFVFRCGPGGDQCRPQHQFVSKSSGPVVAGATICVQSTAGGFAETVVAP